MSDKDKKTTTSSGGPSRRRALAREQREKARRRQRIITIAVVAVAAIGVVGLAIAANLPSGSEPSFVDTSHYDGIQQGFTDDGFPILGDPDAPVIMEEFSNFSCPHCNRFHDTVIGLIDPYIRPGALAVVFIPLTAPGAVAYDATRAALCAGQQGKFWQMHDMIFGGATVYGRNAFVPDMLYGWARSISGLDYNEFSSCMSGSAEVEATIQRASEEAIARGVGGTPAIFFNGARPDCGQMSAQNPNCEGNLPYDMIVDNIEAHLSDE